MSLRTAVSRGAALVAACLASLLVNAEVFVPPLKLLKAFDEEGMPPFAGVLIQLAPGEAYDICLPQRMTREYPGIDEEFRAAVAIWASYIGRDIPVNIVVRKLGSLSNEADQLIYTDACGDVDLIAAFKPMQGSRIGRSALDYRYSWTGSADNKRITGIKYFHRWLYLKQPEPGKFNWRSWRQHFGNTDTASAMVKAMRRRDKYVINNDVTRLTLRTIVHEMGHVWGLCDQYRFKQDPHGNCDFTRAAVDEQGNMRFSFDSMMGSEPWISHLFLRDADIRGIQRLADRFPRGWVKMDWHKIVAPAVAPAPEFVQFDGIWRDPKNPAMAVIQLSLNVGEAVRIEAHTFSGGVVRVRMAPVNLKRQSYRSYQYRLSSALLNAGEQLELMVVAARDNRQVWKLMLDRKHFP